jgi:MFS transporter, YNFM family, putative membrane transport protein
VIARGTRAFRRTNLALFSAGFATFACLYSVQPLLPLFSRAFGRAPAVSSLALSASTAALALALPLASAVADRFGRKPVMAGSLLGCGVLTAFGALAPGFAWLVALRALLGLAMAGLPATAMAYLGEEMAPDAIGPAVGLYIGGSAFGGMSGRLLAGAVAELAGWRAAVLAIGATGIGCAWLLWRFLPASVRFERRPARLGHLGAPLRDPVQVRLFAEGFLLMGGFVTLYNYVGYRLEGPPYRLGQAAIGAIFVVYLAGVASSAYAGTVSARIGRRAAIGAGLAVMGSGLAMTLAAPLALVVAGVAVFTAGFFAAHAVASGWVSAEGGAARAQAASLYLVAYYAGSSVVGSLGGVVWQHAGWGGVAALVAALIMLGFLVAAALPGRGSGSG